MRYLSILLYIYLNKFIYELKYNSGCSMAAIGEFNEVSIHLIIYLSIFIRYNSGCSMAAIGEYTEVSIHLIIYLSMNTDTTLGVVWLL